MASFNKYNAAKSALHALRAAFPRCLSFPSTKDSEWSSRFPGTSTAHIIAEARLEWFDEWRDSKLKHRGAEYEAMKDELSKRLIEPMFAEFLWLREKVTFAELGTPLSSEHYVGSPHSYGLAHTPERFRQVRARCCLLCTYMPALDRSFSDCRIG